MVSESVGPAEVCYLPNTAQTHWQAQRDLQVELITELPVTDPPQLTVDEIARLRSLSPAGTTGITLTRDDP